LWLLLLWLLFFSWRTTTFFPLRLAFNCSGLTEVRAGEPGSRETRHGGGKRCNNRRSRRRRRNRRSCCCCYWWRVGHSWPA
jgi:hypothetical protein